MSTSVSDHQRGKGPGNSGKPPINKFNNASKGGDYEEVDSWRNQPQHHQQGYGQASDPYMSSYYGNFQQQQQYQQGNFGVNENGPWSNGGSGENMGFLGGGQQGNYASQQGMHDSQAGGRYEGDGMFTGGNGGGGRGYNNFSGSGGGPGFGYGYGNGDYSTWGGPQPRKHYDEYYGGRDGMYDARGVKMIEDGMGGLNVHDGLSDKDLKEMMRGEGGSKKTTWASIASQPAKPQTSSKKNKPGMPPPPIIPGAWESKNGQVAKAPIAAPVQAPHPAPAWERPKMVPPPPQHHAPPSHSPPSGGGDGRGGGGGHHGHQERGHQGGIRGGGNYQQHQQMSGGYNRDRGQHGPPPHQQYNQQQQKQHHAPPPPPASSQAANNASSPPMQGNSSSDPSTSPAPPPVYPAEKMKKDEYNPDTFDLSADGARFFVIKSYSEDDIHRSIKYEIWCSTEHGNRRLNEAWKEREDNGPIFLFFSVNGSGHFCGMAQMISNVDYNSSSSVWSQDKWKGQFKVKWIYVKDVPNQQLRNIRLENNENKPVTNSRDTQEVPFEKGKQVLKILHSYTHTTSIFDDFTHYEKRQEEEDQRRVVVQQPPPPPPHMHERNDQGHGGQGGYGGGRGRGGYHGGNHHGMDGNHGGGNFGRGRDRDFGGRGGGHDNPRDFRDHGDRMDRNHDNHRGGGMDRGPPDHYNGRGDGNHRDFYSRDRGDYQPRGGMRGRGGHHNNMRN